MAIPTGDPFSAFGANFGSSLGKGLTGALNDQSPAVSGATAATYGTTLDGSGWSINFGSGSQIATPTSTKTTVPAMAGGNPLGAYNASAGGLLSAGAGAPLPAMQAGMGGGTGGTWLAVAAIALIAVRMLRRRS